MYIRRILVQFGTSDCLEVHPFCEEVRVARTLGYYVNGGVDLDGVSQRRPLPDHFDDAESVSDGVVDLGTDPRVSKMDILAYASTLPPAKQEEAEELIE